MKNSKIKNLAQKHLLSKVGANETPESVIKNINETLPNVMQEIGGSSGGLFGLHQTNQRSADQIMSNGINSGLVEAQGTIAFVSKTSDVEASIRNLAEYVLRRFGGEYARAGFAHEGSDAVVLVQISKDKLDSQPGTSIGKKRENFCDDLFQETGKDVMPPSLIKGAVFVHDDGKIEFKKNSNFKG